MTSIEAFKYGIGKSDLKYNWNWLYGLLLSAHNMWNQYCTVAARTRCRFYDAPVRTRCRFSELHAKYGQTVWSTYRRCHFTVCTVFFVKFVQWRWLCYAERACQEDAIWFFVASSSPARNWFVFSVEVMVKKEERQKNFNLKKSQHETLPNDTLLS